MRDIHDKGSNTDSNVSAGEDSATTTKRKIITGLKVVGLIVGSPLLIAAAFTILGAISVWNKDNHVIEAAYTTMTKITALGAFAGLAGAIMLIIIASGMWISKTYIQGIQDLKQKAAIMFVIAWALGCGEGLYFHVLLTLERRPTPEEAIVHSLEFYSWTRSLTLDISMDEFTKRFNSNTSSSSVIEKWSIDSDNLWQAIDVYLFTFSDGRKMEVHICKNDGNIALVRLTDTIPLADDSSKEPIVSALKPAEGVFVKVIQAVNPQIDQCQAKTTNTIMINRLLNIRSTGESRTDATYEPLNNVECYMRASWEETATGWCLHYTYEFTANPDPKRFMAEKGIPIEQEGWFSWSVLEDLLNIR